MRSATGVIAALVLLASHASAQLDPAQCATASGASFKYDFGASGGCYKGSVDHATSGSATSVEIEVDFADAGVSRADRRNSVDPEFAVLVFDPAQGSDSDATFSFGVTPRVQAYMSSGPQTLSSTTLSTKTSSGFSGTGRYLYSAQLTSPQGLHTIAFEGVSSRSDRLDYIVAVVRLSEAAGHMATSSSSPLSVAFKRQSGVFYVPLGLGNINQIYTEVSGYAPAGDGRAVASLTLAATVDGGASLTSAVVGGSQSSSFVARTGSDVVAHVPLPPTVRPLLYGGQDGPTVPGRLSVRWSFGTSFTANGATTAIDITASPGPFVAFRAGGADDAFEEAKTLSAGQTLEFEFDGTRRSSDDNRAVKAFELVRVSVPAKWWAARFTASAVTVTGAEPGSVGSFSSLVGRFQFSGQTQVVTSLTGSIATSASRDAATGGYVLMNPALSGPASAFEPLGGVSGREVLNTPSGSSPSGWPLYDNRLTAPRPVYMLICRQSNCQETVVTSADTKVTATVKFDYAESFGGECDSSASCVEGPDGHPSQARASGLSANGDPKRFDKCILFAGADGRTPETRCVECFADCDCNPGQFCHRFTGLSVDDKNRPAVVHEPSRLRAGVCMRKDANNTQFGRPCRRTSFSSPSLAGSPAEVFGTSNTPVLKDQAGSVPCGESVFMTADMRSFFTQSYNRTGQAVHNHWTGTCDSQGMCRDCLPGTASNVRTLCGGKHVCLDGIAFRTLSVDQTIRSFTNDTRAGTLLAIVFMMLLLSGIAVYITVVGCCDRRRSAAAADTSGDDDTARTNPALASRRASAAAGAAP